MASFGHQQRPKTPEESLHGQALAPSSRAEKKKCPAGGNPPGTTLYTQRHTERGAACTKHSGQRRSARLSGRVRCAGDASALCDQSAFQRLTEQFKFERTSARRRSNLPDQKKCPADGTSSGRVRVLPGSCPQRRECVRSPEYGAAALLTQSENVREPGQMQAGIVRHCEDLAGHPVRPYRPRS